VLIVLDTNVFISALMSHGGYPDQLLGLWQDNYFSLVTSDFQRNELSRVLSYEKIKPYVSKQEVSRLYQHLDDFSVVVEPIHGISLSVDVDDNFILGTAIAGQVDMLISGDKKHLLPLRRVEDIPILSPHDAIEKILLSRGP